MHSLAYIVSWLLRKKVMSVLEVVNTVPECPSGSPCSCAKCDLEFNKEYNDYLVGLARDYKEEYDSKGSIDLLTCIPEALEKYMVISYFDRAGEESLTSAYAALPEYKPVGDMTLLSSKRREQSVVEHLQIGEEKVVRKTIESEEEPLIHKQLCDVLSNDPYMSRMLPTFLGVDKGEQLAYYMEDVSSVSLSQAMEDGIDGDDVLIAICSLHSLLGLLHSKTGFCHNDLKADNVLLRGYGQGKKWKVPVVIGERRVLVTLPFLPVLIDFGISCTRKYFSSSQLSSPFLSEMVDVIMLYRELDVEVESDHPFARVTERIEKVCGKGWRTAQYILSLPLRMEELTHASMARLYLASE